MAKRILSALVGIALLFLVFFFHNLVIINIAVTAVALLSLWEFYQAFKKKGYRPMEEIGYLVTLAILGIGLVETEMVKIFLFVALPIILLLMFAKSIVTHMKWNVMDIATTLLGIVYVSFFFSFIVFICHLENGHYLIWYVFGGAWMTDTFAYLLGSKFGKHKFSKISVNKSIEGCLAGMVGAVLFYIGYTLYLNQLGFSYPPILMGLMGVFVSIISQLGDMAASSIKRYCDIKDFGNIMPGHGGALDRFDSVIMVAPFVYMLFQFVW